MPSEKVFVTHLAPSSSFHPLKAEEKAFAKQVIRDFKLDKPYIIGIGYEPRKNLAALIKAFQSLPENLKEQYMLALVIANQGIALKMDHQFQQNGLTGLIKIIHGIDNTMLNILYGMSDVMVFPSLREGFGLPPLEAMACGTPVIASNASSMPEVLGNAALSINPLDIREISNAIIAILENSNLRKHLLGAGLKRSNEFSWERTALETTKVYDWVVAEKQRIINP